MALINAVRIRLKTLYEKLPNERIKINFLQALPFWVASLVTGIAAVTYAQLFSYAEQASHYLMHNVGYWIFLITPFCFLVSMVYRQAHCATQSG